MSSSTATAKSATAGFDPVTERKDKNYHLASGGYGASIRLNLQHYLVTEQIDGQLLHPSIKLPNDNSSELSIADVGTGTGIWLLDLQNSVLKATRPKTTYHAFDITTDMFPHPDYLPPNIKFHYLDVLKPIPEEFKSRYDVVNVRFLGPVLHKKGDAEVVVERLAGMLKPGGYLQWAERDMIHAEIITPPNRPDAKQEAVTRFKEMLSKGWKKAEDAYDWTNNLSPRFISNGGLTNVLHERHVTPPHLVNYQMDIICFTFEEAVVTAGILAAKAAKPKQESVKGGDGGDREEERDAGANWSHVLPFIREAYREHREEGTALTTWINVYVGQRKL